MTDQSTFLTPAALRKLEEELEQLKTSGREEIEARIAEARSHGDLRENADYDAAKNAQGLNEARIRQLEAMLKNVNVIEGDPAADDLVSPGVVVEIEVDGDVETYFFGSIEEGHHGHEILTPTSPMGQVLVGAKVGEVRSFETPRGSMLAVTVLSVSPLDS
ncbi:MAG TPA: transcription elongation factor GreA [Acidimicrobiia bacterium]|nr:transcription elongation factor GreA [Acidimicrobiia bacterium]